MAPGKSVGFWPEVVHLAGNVVGTDLASIFVMTRSLRIWIPNVCYHDLSCGGAKALIYCDWIWLHNTT